MYIIINIYGEAEHTEKLRLYAYALKELYVLQKMSMTLERF